MATWDVCYNWVMDDEDRGRQCKIVPDPTSNDPDAQAISGVNSHFYPEWFKKIADLPQDQRGPVVESFYKVTYWNQYRSGLNSDEIAKREMDASVNMGAGTSLKLLQEAANLSGSPTTVDGKWGPGTVQAVNGSKDVIVEKFKGLRLAHYQDIVRKNPSQAHNLGTETHPGPWWVRATK